MTNSPSPADIAALANIPHLLVVADFDGTLAGFSDHDPMDPPVHRPSITALQEMATLPNTRVGVLSGRSLAQLDVVCPLVPPVFRVGSHGAEPDGHYAELTEAQREALAAAEAQLAPVVERYPGSFVETKPYQRVFHFARITTAYASTAREEAEAIEIPGAERHTGRRVVEFSVSNATKGSWLTEELNRSHPDAAIFLGDDTTDETGFEALRDFNNPHYVGLKVGGGETAAPYRVADINAVGEFLTALLAARRDALAAD
ncbi:trehalose-phosphatase [Corynebacterium caspium]|uniref:trehalose-phosphatase n=1 Tax=Corynebacterium caspium TaxID=234828 RepID=UPI00036AE757|nr:trehalose-phosphatase [Corynebacterium caspium]WKD58718.1 Trehalose-6-phosphate phosphatase [Corynebacterium caspium DSM 44850]